MIPDAIILAGGLGTRLRAVVHDRPKVIVPVKGKAFLSLLLDQLDAAGVRSGVLSTGYMADRVEAEIGRVHGRVQLVYSPESEPLGTGGGIRLALEKTLSDPVLVLNGDSFCRFDLARFCQFHHEKQSCATILLAHVADTSRFGSVETGDSGAVLRFAEKGGGHAAGWINAGVYLLNREVITGIPAGRTVSIEREIFPTLAGSGLFGFKEGGDFLDIGTPESYREAERFFG